MKGRLLRTTLAIRFAVQRLPWKQGQSFTLSHAVGAKLDQTRKPSTAHAKGPQAHAALEAQATALSFHWHVAELLLALRCGILEVATLRR